MSTNKHRTRAYGRLALLAILFVAFAARVVTYVIDPKPGYMNNLTAYQTEMARNILDHGKWFVVNDKALDYIQQQQNVHPLRFIDPADMDFSTVDRHAVYTPEIAEVPGLVIPMVAVWSITGQHYVYIRWIQIIVDTAMVLLVYWIAMQLSHNRRIALVSALFYALWPGALIFAYTPLIDTWGGFLMVSALALFIWARSGPHRTAKLVLLGLDVGIGAYFRPFIVLFPFAFAIAELRNRSRREALRNALVPSLIAALCVTPWIVRNALDFHRFIPMRSGVGMSLWEGLGQTPNSFGAVNDDGATIRFVHAHRPDLKFPSPAYDDYLLHRSTQAIRSDPVHYLELVLRRSLYLVPCLLALLWRKRLPMQRALLVATAVAVILPHVLVRTETRYWLPAAFAYLILAAAAIEGGIPFFARAFTPEASPSKLD